MIRREIHQKVKVWTDTELDAIRKEKCLCLRCEYFDNCGAAYELSKFCKQHDVALATTRCRQFEPGEKHKSELDEEREE